jgi:branched-chain amino acid transport system ATP-binding protein
MLKIENISLAYGDLEAVHDLSLVVERGKIVVIVGGNGAGKTSLIRGITGLQPLQSGRVLFQGEDITNHPTHQICDRGMGHIPEGREVFAQMTVRENLEVGGMMRRARPRLKQNLEKVFALFPLLSQRAQQLAGTLSGGEQQMLAIGRCLMGEPQLIVLDEPSLGLSPLIVRQMLGIVKQLHSQGLTILLVEQNVVASLEIADYGYVLENAQIVLKGTAQELLQSEQIRESYLGL